MKNKNYDLSENKKKELKEMQKLIKKNFKKNGGIYK
jgi:hypothetical protein